MPAPQQALALPEDPNKSSWFETGQAITRVKLSRFCDELLVLQLLKPRAEFAARFPMISDQIAVKEFFGCYKVSTMFTHIHSHIYIHTHTHGQRPDCCEGVLWMLQGEHMYYVCMWVCFFCVQVYHTQAYTYTHAHTRNTSGLHTYIYIK
jgi:hypothetical protein